MIPVVSSQMFLRGEVDGTRVPGSINHDKAQDTRFVGSAGNSEVHGNGSALEGGVEIKLTQYLNVASDSKDNPPSSILYHGLPLAPDSCNWCSLG
jgi:hypothetical protein